MALSNILKEPRREITEQLVGTLVIFGLPVAGAIFARYAPRPSDYTFWDMMGIGLSLGTILALGVAAVVAVANIVHAIGEATCNALEARGVHLRPRRRY